MTEIEKVLYAAKTHTSGGREGGVSRSSDGRLDVTFTPPGAPGSGTNPSNCSRLVGRPVSLVR
jgi:lipoyl-dependent peroxiredoxin